MDADSLIEFVNKPRAETAISNDNAKNNSSFLIPNSSLKPPLPTRQPLKVEPAKEPVEESKPARQSRLANRVKLYLYLNGKLTKNRGEHTTAGTVYLSADECKNWQRNERDYSLFPSNWTARLTVENFTAEDFVNPQVKVSFGGNDNFSVDIPTVKAGQTVDVDIPIACKPAFHGINGTISVWAGTIGEDLGYTLIRNLKIKS